MDSVNLVAQVDALEKSVAAGDAERALLAIEALQKSIVEARSQGPVGIDLDAAERQLVEIGKLVVNDNGTGIKLSARDVSIQIKAILLGVGAGNGAAAFNVSAARDLHVHLPAVAPAPPVLSLKEFPAKNPHFTGRKEIFSEIRKRLTVASGAKRVAFMGSAGWESPRWRWNMHGNISMITRRSFSLMRLRRN